MSHQAAARGQGRPSARLGLTLRSILLSPTAGFTAADQATGRRARAGRRPVEGMSPYVLTAFGGASLCLLWLKIGALLGLRKVCPGDRIAAYIAAAAVLGALLGLLAQALWGLVGQRVVGNLRGSASGSQLRLVWGAAALPQVFAIVVLLPLDLVLVGTNTFTSASLAEPVETAWAAASIALSLSLGVWSVYLFARGLNVVTGLKGRRNALAMGAAGLCMAVAIALFVVPGSFAPKGAACPTPLG